MQPKAHPLVVEQAKNDRERGFYIHPELFGQPEEKQLEWSRRPELMHRMKASRMAAAQASQSEVSTSPIKPQTGAPASAVERKFAAAPKPTTGKPLNPASAVKPKL